jgi:hypothetical protein
MEDLALAYLPQGLFAAVGSLQKSITSDAATALQPIVTAPNAPIQSDWNPPFGDLPHELFAAGYPLHELHDLITSKIAAEIVAQDKADSDE